MKLTSATCLANGTSIKVTWNDKSTARFHAVWLRDNSLDPDTRNASNGQRLISVLDIPSDIAVTETSITPDGALSILIAPEMKKLIFPADWLKRNSYDHIRHADNFLFEPSVKTWNEDLQNHIPTATWDKIRLSQSAFADWLSDIQRYGFAVLEGVPQHSGAVCEVAELFGHVRKTNYGRWFEVRSEVNPSNLAYTNLGLQAHTDNPYRDPVPTLQLLSCLDNSVDGGHSIVVDGFAAAKQLQTENPEAAKLLSKYRATFHYAGSADVDLRADKPVIDRTEDGQITAIHFNNRSAAPLVHVPYDEMERYYEAYRAFSEIIDDSCQHVHFKLTPGTMFIVDNTRVLHARTAFSGSGTRWLQGCYADKDGLLSTLNVIGARQSLGNVA